MKNKENNKSTSIFSMISSSPTESGTIQTSDKSTSESNHVGLVKSMVTEQSKKSDMLLNTCYYQVRGNKMLKYELNELRSIKQKEISEQLNITDNLTYRGEMSEISKRNLRHKMEIWYDSLVYFNNKEENVLQHINYKFGFLTLTLPANQFHSDKEIKERILKPFLRVLRLKYALKNYIWKAESQHNGNIHFHLIIDKYLPKETISTIWNLCCDNLGYLEEFEKKFHHCNPPSTKIEGVTDYRKAMAYLEKYICKEPAYRKIDGALWKASKSVLSLEFFEFPADNIIDNRIDTLITNKTINYFSSERYEIYFLNQISVFEIMPLYISRIYHKFNELLSDYLFVDQSEKTFIKYVYSLCAIVINESDVVINQYTKIRESIYQCSLFETPVQNRDQFTAKKDSKKNGYRYVTIKH